ncbi:putative HTH La-type RNA-binding protein [Beauveria bassiana D1-5]|uniref:Putative HTH La-type RNA-binding protein n=1 Tax=Beauveria bassiana D1-5 TaxID=1245745 RepID=A0A0A2V6C2_BEABA|nr:putative HTH La-type RNA-binding protein [Beauveria bassiana D1-5]
MAAASTFSYAQAAKGQNSTPESPQSTSQATDSLSTIPAFATTPLDDASVADSSKQDSIATSADKHEAASTVGSESDISESVISRRTDKREQELSRLERPWRRTDREGQPSTQSHDDADSKRRKGKKKGADKPAEEEEPKVELTEAPVPSVNIWQQRREAAAAAKVVKPDDANSTTALEDVKPLFKVTDFAGAVNGHKSTRKVDIPRPERASRGVRVADKEAREGKGELPPPVEDAMLWPTPETAVQEDRDSKKKNDAKTELKESQEDAGKPRSKEKWVTYDYVPTVNFETQLPQMRNTKPRGGARNINGSRPNATGQAGDKTASATSAAKINDRRQSTANVAPRTGSQPPGKRASVDVATLREQRKVSGSAASEKAKDATPASAQEQTQAPRERADGRADRGRGGYRGRGGHHTNSHSQHQHVASFNGNGPAGSRPQGPYSPPPRGGHGQMFMPPSQRGRGGRSNAANFHRMSLPNGRLPPVQTQFASYEYSMAPISAVPFQPQPYWDNMMVPVLKNQIEYYFSIENLCKDMYLRQRMDSQGFVPLHFIAAFKRVRELSADIGMLRVVCEMSLDVDLVVGEDEIERVRRRDGWESFVLPLKDRDDLARNHGPVKLSFKNRAPYTMPPQFNGIQVPYGVPSSPAFIPQEQLQQFDHHAMNGVNGHSQKGSQLSAAVPDFAPSGAVQNPAAKANGTVNGIYEKQNSVHAGAEA